MLEFLKDIKNDNPDAILFLPGEKEHEVQVEGAAYLNPGDDVGGSLMGKSYDIILFKENYKEDKIYNVDKFEAILSEPFEYISSLIPQNWFGIIARKTTTSNNFVCSAFDKLKEL